MAPRIEFGSRDAAGKIRNNAQYRGFLAESDDGRESTLVLKDGVPEPVLDEITGEAADSTAHEADKSGQSALSSGERERIDFSREGMNVPKARSIKGIAENEGVDDWTSYADFEVSVDENRAILKRAKQEEGGMRGGRESLSDAEVDKRLAQAHHERQSDEMDRAKDFALVETDQEAQEFLDDRGITGGLFDIEYSREDGRPRGQGEDFERLEERHESRTQRAQTVDEMRTAEITRDPIDWTNSPDELDYPGIDTVQPLEIHEGRSERAQEQDEQELAPIADTKEQWAMSQDRYDWRGVDTPTETVSDTSADSDPADVIQRVETQELPIPERDSDAPEPMAAGLLDQDVSLSPAEAFEGAHTESASRSTSSLGLAGEEEADMAFVQAEQDRIDETFDAIDDDVDGSLDDTLEEIDDDIDQLL